MWDLPRLGIEPVSSALAGSFTEPQWGSLEVQLICEVHLHLFNIKSTLAFPEISNLGWITFFISYWLLFANVYLEFYISIYMCRRKWQPTPVFLPEKSHGQGNLVGYSPWGCKELDTAEQLHILYMSVICLWFLFLSVVLVGLWYWLHNTQWIQDKFCVFLWWLYKAGMTFFFFFFTVC